MNYMKTIKEINDKDKQLTLMREVMFFYLSYFVKILNEIGTEDAPFLVVVLEEFAKSMKSTFQMNDILPTLRKICDEIGGIKLDDPSSDD